MGNPTSDTEKKYGKHFNEVFINNLFIYNGIKKITEKQEVQYPLHQSMN